MSDQTRRNPARLRRRVLFRTNSIPCNDWSFNPAGGTWTVTGSLNTPRAGTATLLANGMVLAAGEAPVCERGTVRSGRRKLGRHRESQHPAQRPHRDVAAQQHGAIAGDLAFYRIADRGTLRSGERYLDCHGQSQPHAAFTRRRCCPTVWCLSQEDKATTQLRRARVVRCGERELDRHRQPQHRTHSAHGDAATQRHGAGRRRV